MAGILDINNNPLKIISKYAKKEYKCAELNCDSYTGLQNSLVRIYKKENKSQLEEMKIEVEMLIEHNKLYNFESFFSIRYAFYALTLGLIAIIASNPKFINLYQSNFESIIKLISLFLILVLIISRYALDKQKENLSYCNFKLKCMNIALNNIKNLEGASK